MSVRMMSQKPQNTLEPNRNQTEPDEFIKAQQNKAKQNKNEKNNEKSVMKKAMKREVKRAMNMK